MKKRLSRISPLQLGIVLAVFYGLFSLVLVVPMGFFFAIASAIGGGHSFNGGSAIPPALPGIFLGGFMTIFIPIVHAIFGFIVGVIAAAIYNLAAKITGGIEFSFQDAPEE